MEKDGRILAHVGLWPVTTRTGERGIHMIDWAADPQSPGVGLSLLQRLTKTYDFVYSIGGSEMTQSILPKFGFRTVADAQTWARPIRPWRQMFHHQSKGWRLPLRLARNIWWSRAPARTVPRGWATIEPGAEGFTPLASERDASFFRYLAQCPTARCLTFHIVNDGRKAGCFALSVVGEQARLAGVWLENPSAANCLAAFQLAQDAALRCTAASELVLRCATEVGAAAAAQAGMRLRARTPVFLFRNGVAAEGLPLQFHLCDNDSVFWEEPDAGFLT
jgi:hypothetical protein